MAHQEISVNAVRGRNTGRILTRKESRGRQNAWKYLVSVPLQMVLMSRRKKVKTSLGTLFLFAMSTTDRNFTGKRLKLTMTHRLLLQIEARRVRKQIRNEGIIYDEMRKAKSEMDNGKPIELALEDFGFRCGCKEVRKFVSLYLQNMVKGGPEFSGLLQDMAEKAWDERKTRARLAGAVAEQKLLIPIMIMFIGVLIMVIVPAFNNLF